MHIQHCKSTIPQLKKKKTRLLFFVVLRKWGMPSPSGSTWKNWGIRYGVQTFCSSGRIWGQDLLSWLYVEVQGIGNVVKKCCQLFLPALVWLVSQLLCLLNSSWISHRRIHPHVTVELVYFGRKNSPEPPILPSGCVNHSVFQY